MIDIRCDHVQSWWRFRRQCKATATKHLLHHPKNGYGDDPQVLLLCNEHHQVHIEQAVAVVTAAKVAGRPLALSHIIKDAGTI